MKKYGIFISYKSKDWGFAGRVYDYLEKNGFFPFLDKERMHHRDHKDALKESVEASRCFLLLLTANTFANGSDPTWIINEIRWAMESGLPPLVLVEAGNRNADLATLRKKFTPKSVPEEIRNYLEKDTGDTIHQDDFNFKMDRLITSTTIKETFNGVLDWKAHYSSVSNTYVASCKQVQTSFATYENRFGHDFIQCVKKYKESGWLDEKEYKDHCKIRRIRMACYAANQIFTPQRNMIAPGLLKKDDVMLADIIEFLLRYDEDFTFEIIFTAPYCRAALEAENNKKLGNLNLEEKGTQAVFLSSFYNVYNLTCADSNVYRKAKDEGRFSYYVTDISLPYAIFEVTYKDEAERYTHVKVDLYSPQIDRNDDRRSMIIFKEADPNNFNFFSINYNNIKQPDKSKKLIKTNKHIWLRKWKKIQKEHFNG